MLLLVKPPSRTIRSRNAIRHLPNDWSVMVLDLWIGIVFIITHNVKADLPAYRLAQRLLPQSAWGVLFILLGALVGFILCRMKTAHVVGRTTYVLVRLSQAIGPGLYTAWAVLYLFGAYVRFDAVSLVSAGVSLYIAYRHMYCPAVRLSS